MATSVASVVSHFPEAENGFTTTTAGSVASGAATVTLNSVAGYTNGMPVVLIIDPTDVAKKQTFTGIVDTAGVQITSVVWTAGTNQTHALGATVVDYATATHISMVSKGLLIAHDQDGTLKAGAVDVAAVITDAIVTRPKLATTFAQEVKDGWLTGDLPAVSSVTNNGNRSETITFASTVASLLSPGMRLRTTRTVSAPTQCTDLEASSSQYFSSASAGLGGMTQTDNFTYIGWVKPESYSQGVIAARIDGTAANGHFFRMDASGTICIGINNAGAGNYRVVNTYQSLSLSKWVHVAMTYATGTVTAYIDGVAVPTATAVSAGTNPTVAVAGGDWAIGRLGSFNGQYFDGKLAQVGFFSSVLSASTIRSYMSQGLSGSESTLVSAFSCNNSLLDLNTTNNNDLTANGGAVMTNADSPFANATGTPSGTTDVALVMSVTTTDAVVQLPEGCTIPTSGGVSAVAYSTTANPFGWPMKANGKVLGDVLIQISDSTTSATADQINGATITFNVPQGGGRVMVSLFGGQALGNDNAAASSILQICRDSAADANRVLQQQFVQHATVGEAIPPPRLDYVEDLPAGSNTFVGSFAITAGGTTTYTSSSVAPIRLMATLLDA